MREKICIGIPCYSTVAGETLEDYMRFAYQLGRRYLEYDFFLCIKTKSEQFRARNVIVESAISIGCDWLLMIDDDHILDTEGSQGDSKNGSDSYNFLRKLLEHNVDIVGPVYYQRGGSVKPVVMEEDEFGNPYFISDSDLGHCLEERAIQGGGCMLIKMEVFNKIQSPWFEPEFQWGTDIQLCKKARAAGFKVYNDSSLEIGHVKNARTIITSKNKHMFQTGKSVDPVNSDSTDWRTDSILHKLKYDAAEYLGIKENDADAQIESLKQNYGMHSLALELRYGLGTEEYYGHMGPEQLCRNILFHHAPSMKLQMAQILQEVKPQKLVGMDFGCGPAAVGFELAKRGGTMHFIDVDGACSYEFLKWRCKKYGLTNVSFDWPKPNTLNYCICLDSIEHLTDWQGTIKKIIGCLKPGGNFMTNFMRIADSENPEHVFMDKPAFIAFMVDNDMLIHSNYVFIKRFSE